MFAAGLSLFTLHASQFSTCLLDNYASLFEVLSKWCSHMNVELKKAAHSALESFLKQVLCKTLYKDINFSLVHEHLKKKIQVGPLASERSFKEKSWLSFCRQEWRQVCRKESLKTSSLIRSLEPRLDKRVRRWDGGKAGGQGSIDVVPGSGWE